MFARLLVNELKEVGYERILGQDVQAGEGG